MNLWKRLKRIVRRKRNARKPIVKPQVVRQVHVPKHKYVPCFNSKTWHDVLRALDALGPLSRRVLAKQVDTQTSGVVLTQMYRDGVVSRDRITTGSCEWSYQLTEAGREQLAKIDGAQ